MSHNDNWGWQARIGLFVVSSEAVPEAEWWAMAPPHVSMHSARVTAKAPWAAWRADRSGVDLADDLARGARQFSEMRLTAAVLAHTSSSIAGGRGWDEAVIDAMSRAMCVGLAKGAVVTTNGIDTAEALRAVGVRRPYIVLPAWFADDTIDAASRYYVDHGFSPSGAMKYDPGRKWREAPPRDLYGLGMGFEQEIEPLYAQIRASCPATADGVLIAGTGFRCVGLIEALERDLKRPVITANQASLWRCLRLSGVRAAITGYGGLLAI
jgi:maleate isomerase